MRTLLVLATLALLTVPAADADPLTPVREAGDHAVECLEMTTYPYENPLQTVPALAAAALCIVLQ